jgi:hypothetical protein
MASCLLRAGARQTRSEINQQPQERNRKVHRIFSRWKRIPRVLNALSEKANTIISGASVSICIKFDDGLRKQTDKEGHERKIKAIGILGGDVFDKLLILRALRPEFPEALFFTTDFDEAFTIKSELPFTRNLIISSSFGPNLSEWLHGDIPFFRDTYQTSHF